MGFLSAWRERRRERAALLHPVPDELWDWAVKEHRIFRWLCPADLARLRSLAAAFLAEKTFDPVGGAVVDEELRVSVAAQACLPLLGLPGGLDWYRDFSTIIVTPREYAVAKRDWDEAGVVHEYDDEFAGEAFDLGPVALSRVDIEASGWGDGYNVVIHEMAHKLDGRSGGHDGCPPLHRGMEPGAWKRAFSAAYADLRERLEKPAPRKPRRGRLKAGGQGPAAPRSLRRRVARRVLRRRLRVLLREALRPQGRVSRGLRPARPLLRPRPGRGARGRARRHGRPGRARTRRSAGGLSAGSPRAPGAGPPRPGRRGGSRPGRGGRPSCGGRGRGLTRGRAHRSRPRWRCGRPG